MLTCYLVQCSFKNIIFVCLRKKLKIDENSHLKNKCKLEFILYLNEIPRSYFHLDIFTLCTTMSIVEKYILQNYFLFTPATRILTCIKQ